MVVENRQTGIKVVGPLPWGSHICVFYNSLSELKDIFVPFFQAGLENNEHCIWIPPDPGNQSDREAIDRVASGFSDHLKTGQLTVFHQDEFYLENGVFKSARAFNILLLKYTQAMLKGYRGVRIGGCAPELEDKEWLAFHKYEAEANNALEKGNMMGLCAYAIDKCRSRQLIDILNTHQYVLNMSDSRYVFLGDRNSEPVPEADKQTENGYRHIIRDLRRQLRESEDKYAKAVRGSDIMVCITKLNDGTFIEVNDNMCRTFGYRREEMIGNTSTGLNMWSPEERRRVRRKFQKTQRVQNEKTTLRTKSGELLTVLYSIEKIDLNGQSRIISVLTDITGLKKEKEKERAIISAAIDGFWITDLNGKFLEVNDSYCRMIGYTREELLKMSIADVEALESPEETAERVKKLLINGSDRFKTRHRCKSGKIIDIEINVNYYNVGKGQLFVFIHDLTGREEAEDGRNRRIETRWRKNITRLQEQFIKEGLENFQDRQIIELLLSMVMPSRRARQLAEVCIDKFKNLVAFLNASAEDLMSIGVSPPCVFCITMLHKLITKVLQEKIREQSIYDSPQDIFDYFYYSMRDLDKEVFKIMFLNARNQIMDVIDFFKGTADKITVDPREVVESAIARGTRALVFVHNHPSGDPTPSQPDRHLTRDLVFVGNILQIKVLDHIIIGENRYFSFAAEGLIKEYEMDFLNLRLTGTSEARRRISRARDPDGQ